MKPTRVAALVRAAVDGAALLLSPFFLLFLVVFALMVTTRRYEASGAMSLFRRHGEVVEVSVTRNDGRVLLLRPTTPGADPTRLYLGRMADWPVGAASALPVGTRVEVLAVPEARPVEHAGWARPATMTEADWTQGELDYLKEYLVALLIGVAAIVIRADLLFVGLPAEADQGADGRPEPEEEP